MMNKLPSRDAYDKVYGRDSSYEVFKHNFLKMVCVNILSKSFLLMVISGTASMFIIFWTIVFSKEPLNWLIYAVLIAAPSFFGLWWIEKKRAGELIDAVAKWIGSKK